MLGKLSIIGAVTPRFLMIPTALSCKLHSPYGENFANNLFASACVSRRPSRLRDYSFDQSVMYCLELER
jgi:hypothetical protein